MAAIRRRKAARKHLNTDQLRGEENLTKEAEITGKVAGLVVAVLSLVLLTASCLSPVPQRSEAVRQTTIAVYGFSVEQEVMAEEVFPAFQDYWQEQTGQEVTLQSVFASSDEVTEEILEGASADVAILSNEQYAVWLRINDWVETDWHTFPHQGIFSRSPIVIVVRPGNPLGIKDWADLARPGVGLVHPDPQSSGGAQWALLSEYGSALLDEKSGSQEAAHDLGQRSRCPTLSP
jgi:ABC-type sulfate transport system substrate-binding protein